MHTDDEKELQDQQQDAAEVTTEVTTEAAADDLDLDALDLTVETVEERISPRETNVFDK